MAFLMIAAEVVLHTHVHLHTQTRICAYTNTCTRIGKLFSNFQTWFGLNKQKMRGLHFIEYQESWASVFVSVLFSSLEQRLTNKIIGSLGRIFQDPIVVGNTKVILKACCCSGGDCWLRTKTAFHSFHSNSLGLYKWWCKSQACRLDACFVS